MREVKEKSPLKDRAAETLKSAPQAAFRRGTDASFQQLRQELRDAAQDGQPEDRYESGKITDTADHAVQEVRHLAEKAAHRLPKTKSEPQPDYPPQSQPQVNPPVRELASPIREKPIPPANTQQPKTRAYTPDAKAPASPSRYPVPWVHENAKTTSAEAIAPTTGGTEKHELPVHHLWTERAVRESASPIKEKAVSPANVSQPKMREYAPNADVSVHRSQHPALQIHEKPQAVSRSQVNQPVRELGSSVKEISAVKAKKDAPRTADRQPKARKDCSSAQASEKIPAQAKKQPLGQSPAITEPAVPETTLTTPPAARTLPKEKPLVSSLREIPAALKTDTT